MCFGLESELARLTLKTVMDTYWKLSEIAIIIHLNYLNYIDEFALQ